MPIYEYRCASCDHLLEALQQVGEDPLRDCPACGRDTLRRRISAAAFRFKGSGWYETDFKTGKRKNLADGGGDADTKGEGKKKKDDTGDSSGEQKSSDQKAGAASGGSTESGGAATGP